MMEDYMEDIPQEDKDIVKTWDALADPMGLVSHLQNIWAWEDYIRVRGKRVIHLEIHTGGWSEHEEVIGNLMENNTFWPIYWQMSKRGGHYYFEIRRIKNE
jgi:hypothetical protein